MGWHPHVREHHRRGRKPWYTLQLGGREIHLGIDPAAAYRRASKLLEQGGVVRDAPASVAGLIAGRLEMAPRDGWRYRYWAEFAGSRPLLDLTSKDLQRYADHLGKVRWRDRQGRRHPLAPWTIRHNVSDARQLWRWGLEQGWLTVEPGRVKTPRPHEQDRSRDAGEIVEALGKIRSPRAVALLRFVAAMGCRPGEARLLRWDRVDLKHAVCNLSAHKTAASGQARTLYLTPPAIEILRAQERRGQWVFPSRTGKPYTRQGLHSIAYRAGLSSTYALRHTFAQWFLDQGGEGGKPGLLQDLQTLLGHRHITTTQIYARVRDQRAREVAGKLTGPLAG